MAEKTFTIVYQDGSQIQCDFVEHVPYEPAAYHWDDGIIVEAHGTNNWYFISCGTGMIYCGRDDDPDEITQVVEGATCPEIEKLIEAERAQEAQMELC